MKVMKLAQSPAPTIDAKSSVYEAVKIMEKACVGALAVTEKGRLVGVVSERDVMVRVVGARKAAQKTKVKDVMTTAVKTMTPDQDTSEALSVMVENHIRHLVVVNKKGAVVGLLQMRNAFPAQLEAVEDQLRTLTAYCETDCLGG